MRIVKLVLLIFILFSIAVCQLLLNDNNMKMPHGASYSGAVRVSYNDFVTLPHDGVSGLPLLGKGMYSGPGVFDIGSDSSIFVLYSWVLHRFSNSGKLLCSTKVSRDVCDFKYYDNGIFIFIGESLAVYSADSLQLQTTISLKTKNFTPAPVRNRSYFFDKYLFLRDFDSTTVVKLKSVFDLSKFNLMEIADGDTENIPVAVYNCNECDYTFLKRLFSFKPGLAYKGQSQKLLVYTYTCSPTVRPAECKKDVKEYYLWEKEKNKIYKFNFDENRIGKITLASRPFVFINDSTAIVQTAIVNKLSQNKVNYTIITFHMAD